MSIDLSKYQAVLLDLDGTIFHEEQALPGAMELLRKLSGEEKKFACLSNSTTTAGRIVSRLSKMGVELSAAAIHTAADAAAEYVMHRFGAGGRKPRVFNLATEGIQEILTDRVRWVENEADECQAVIVGAPSNVYAVEQRQRMALGLLRQGALAVGICQDRVYPSPRGFEFGSGALCAMLGFAAGVTPVFCGKPQRIFFEDLCRRLDVDPRACVLIGDNLESDIAGAKGMGMTSVLTLTGIATRQDAQNAPLDLRPDFIIADLRELL